MNENQATIQSYENNPDDYIRSSSIDEQPQLSAWIVSELDTLGQSPSIFEVGSGPGYTADYLESLGYVVMRSDIVERFVQFNENRGKKIAKHNVVLDPVPGLFDVIIAVNVMQHLNHDDMTKAVRHIYKGLGDKGKFLFTIILNDVEEWHDDKGGARYFAAWAEDDLLSMLIREGFSNISVAPVGYRNWVNVVAQKNVAQAGISP